MTGLRAELARLAAWSPARTALAATLGLVGLTYVLLGIAAARLPGSEWAVAEALLAPPAAHASLVLVLVAFGGPFAAALGGAMGAAAGAEMRDAAGTHRRGNPGPGRAARAAPAREPTGIGPAFVALALLVLAGLLVAYAWGVAAMLVGAGLAGREPATLLDPAAADGVPAVLGRGWLAVVALASVGYAAGLLTGRRLAGLGVVGGLFLVELLAGAVDPAAPVLGVAPISRLAGLVGSGTAGELGPAVAMAGTCIVGALAFAAVLQRRGAPDRPAG